MDPEDSQARIAALDWQADVMKILSAALETGKNRGKDFWQALRSVFS